MRKLVLILIGFIALMTFIRGMDYTFEIDAVVVNPENVSVDEPLAEQ